ncbi:hypothetical protein RMCBS344292_04427 [Rhizopus microsporus]|nr:hypothetical protein RMCBS344292_04427 [Rhizopus microsporus]
MSTNNTQKKPISFITLNVRHDHHQNSTMSPFAAPPTKENPFDTKEFYGEQPWSIRKWKVMDTILLYSPDIETVYHQILDLEALLGEEYKWVGVGREDGDKEGEISAIFYKSDVLSIESWKTVWLSETPENVGSIGWDARHSRTATQILFKREDDGSKFTVFNTHMDHVGSISREESAKLLLERAREASSDGPVFLLGDLNATEEDPAYLVLTNSKYKDTKGQNDTLANLEELNNVCASASVNKTGVPVRTTEGSITLPTHRVIRPGRILENLKKKENSEQTDMHFVDARYELVTRLTSKGAPGTLSGPFGYRDTLTSFGTGDTETERAPICIDYILVLDVPKFNLHVQHYAVLSNKFDDGLYFSDHRPVLSRISWH